MNIFPWVVSSLVTKGIPPAFSGKIAKKILLGELAHALECFVRCVGQSLFLGSSFTVCGKMVKMSGDLHRLP